MEELGLDAIYVKILLAPHELISFFSYTKKLGIQGLSVTLPLKEQVLPFLDEVDPKAHAMGAINTIDLKEGKLTGYNTDAKGALKALLEKTPIKDKKIVIIGAGGAAKAISYELKKQGALLTIVNRTKEKADTLANKLQCQASCLKDIPLYDIIINCTSSHMPIDKKFILENTVVMDIAISPNTEFLLEAKKKKCYLVYGYKMFIYQALKQFKIWFGSKIDLSKVENLLEEKTSKVLILLTTNNK